MNNLPDAICDPSGEYAMLVISSLWQCIICTH